MSQALYGHAMLTSPIPHRPSGRYVLWRQRL